MCPKTLRFQTNHLNRRIFPNIAICLIAEDSVPAPEHGFKTVESFMVNGTMTFGCNEGN